MKKRSMFSRVALIMATLLPLQLFSLGGYDLFDEIERHMDEAVANAFWLENEAYDPFEDAYDGFDDYQVPEAYAGNQYGQNVQNRYQAPQQAPRCIIGDCTIEEHLNILNLGDQRDANGVDEIGRTRLHYAVEIGCLDLTHALVAAGADVTARDRYGQNPVQMAFNAGNFDLLRILQQSPDVDQRCALCRSDAGAFIAPYSDDCLQWICDGCYGAQFYQAPPRGNDNQPQQNQNGAGDRDQQRARRRNRRRNQNRPQPQPVQQQLQQRRRQRVRPQPQPVQQQRSVAQPQPGRRRRRAIGSQPQPVQPQPQQRRQQVRPQPAPVRPQPQPAPNRPQPPQYRPQPQPQVQPQQLQVPRRQQNYRPHGQLNRLPREFDHEPIYYVYTNQRWGWSCGYHALFAACNVEQMFGKGNRFSNWNTFTQFTSPFVAQRGLRPSDASQSDFLENHSRRLGLDSFMYLNYIDGAIRPQIHDRIYIQWAGRISQAQKQQMYRDEYRRREAQLLADIQNRLNGNQQSPFCVHCVCHVINRGVDHVILISVVQHAPNERSMYIYDNCNEQIVPGSQMYEHINYIRNLFNV